MKVFILIIYLLVSAFLNAQVRISSYLEDSQIGMQQGVTISYILFQKLESGLFYQSNLFAVSKNDDSNLPGQYPFIGTYLSYQIMYSQKLSLEAGSKLGVVNEKYVVLTPQVTTRMSFSKKLSAFLAMSYRVRHPALSTGISLSL